MQHLDLDYDDVGATAVTGRPTTDLHDLRTVLVTTDPIVARRIERALSPMGARLAIIPDWGHVSLAEVRGLDPQLVLLEPGADLKSRADMNRRLAEEPRLKWAVLDRAPRNLDGRAGVDRLVELAAVALGPDRQLQAEVLLEMKPSVAPVDAMGPGRLLRALSLGDETFEIRYEEQDVEAYLRLGDGRLLDCTWTEHGVNETRLEGVSALTAFTALGQGEVRIQRSARTGELGLGALEELLEEAADPGLSWVATRVATGRYLFPPPGVASYHEGDLPEASNTRRAKAPKITIDVSPLAPSRTMPGMAALPAVLVPDMPRMPRPSGPKALVETIDRPVDQTLIDTVERVLDQTLVETAERAIEPIIPQSIVALTPPLEEAGDASESYDDYEDGASSSLHLDVEVEAPAEESGATASPGPDPFALTAEMPVAAAVTPAPAVSAWPMEPAPVSAADSIRPAMGPVVIPQRRLWPWALAALAVLGLAAGGGAVALVGPSAIADYVESPGDIFADFEGLDIEGLDIEGLDFEGLDVDMSVLDEALGEGEPVALPAASTSAPLGAPSAVEPMDEAEADSADAEMVFDLDETTPEADEEEGERGPRRRVSRRRTQRMLAEAHGAPTASAAAERYEEVLARDPHNAVAMQGLARAKMAMRDFAGAIEWAERATQERPRHAPTWGLLGDALRRSGNVEAAQRAYDRASALDPNTPPPVVPDEATAAGEAAQAEPEAPAEDAAIDPGDEVAALEAEASAEEPDTETAPSEPTAVPRRPEGPPDQLAPRSGGLPPAL